MIKSVGKALSSKAIWFKSHKTSVSGSDSIRFGQITRKVKKSNPKRKVLTHQKKRKPPSVIVLYAENGEERKSMETTMTLVFEPLETIFRMCQWKVDKSAFKKARTGALSRWNVVHNHIPIGEQYGKLYLENKIEVLFCSVNLLICELGRLHGRLM